MTTLPLNGFCGPDISSKPKPINSHYHSHASSHPQLKISTPIGKPEYRTQKAELQKIEDLIRKASSQGEKLAFVNGTNYDRIYSPLIHSVKRNKRLEKLVF